MLEVSDAYEVYDVPAQKIANDNSITIGDVYEAFTYNHRNTHIIKQARVTEERLVREAREPSVSPPDRGKQ